MDDAAFLQTLQGAEAEIDTLLVYADWLEEQGNLPRATFVRTQHRLLSIPLPVSKAKSPTQHRALTKQELAYLDVAAEVVKAARAATTNKKDKEWIAALARPPLLETYWVGMDSDKALRTFWFRPKGIMHWSSPTGKFKDGFWSQIGSTLLLTVNKKYVTMKGVIVGTQMFGTAINIHDVRWSWRLVRRATTPDAAKKQEAAPKKAVVAKKKATATTKPKRTTAKKKTAKKTTAKKKTTKK